MSEKIILSGDMASALRKHGQFDPAANPPTDRELKLGAKIVQLLHENAEGAQLLKAVNELCKRQQQRLAAFEACFAVAPLAEGGEAVEIDEDALLRVMYGDRIELEIAGQEREPEVPAS